MSGGGKQGLYLLWKYCNLVPRPKGSGVTATITCKLCQMPWQGTYTRVRAHFLHISRKGVDCYPNEIEQYDAVRDQERADGKVANMSSHASTTWATTAAQNQNKDSEADVCVRDVAIEYSRKKPDIGSSNPIGRLFDVHGQEAVYAIIA
ncbi:hypothetical protein SUGI_1020870 [Cryptomeria japonica]|nr:hypothetical protein SUGI_1020870 [Cryptomeria japonica]